MARLRSGSARHSIDDLPIGEISVVQGLATDVFRPGLREPAREAVRRFRDACGADLP
jgi:hypothetical protein